MRIFLAAWPSQRIQLLALLLERSHQGLSSYAFHDKSPQNSQAWDQLWATFNALAVGDYVAATAQLDAIGGLTVEERARMLNGSLTHRPRMLIDSGAFTVRSTGDAITVADYAKWAKQFRKKRGAEFDSLDFVTLDVIGDQRATWANTAELRRLGLDVLPVVTMIDAKLRDIDKALERSEYICFGGMPKGMRRIQCYLDPAWAHVWKWAEKHGHMSRIHLLGITRDWMLYRYPAYSSDSSTWCDVVRYGKANTLGVTLPKAGKTPPRSAQRVAQLHSLRAELQRYRRMEEHATILWKARGVDFGKDS